MILVMLALAVLVLPLQWVAAMVLAAVFHEVCHYLVIRYYGGKILGVTVQTGGAKLEVTGLSNGQELCCALAGPLGGFLLLFGLRWMPRTAICAVFQSLYNLLPIYPLDGGRALRCGMELILPLYRADQVCLWAQRIAVALVVMLGVYGTVFLRLGWTPILLSMVIFGKIACKPHRH